MLFYDCLLLLDEVDRRLKGADRHGDNLSVDIEIHYWISGVAAGRSCGSHGDRASSERLHPRMWREGRRLEHELSLYI